MAAVRCLGLFRTCRTNGLFQILRANNKPRILKLSSQRISTSSFKYAAGEDKEDIKEPSTWLSNILGYNQEEEQSQVLDPEETKEREALFKEIADMYFSKPRRTPDLKFIERIVDCLIRYDDYEGVNGVWLIMQDMKLEPPEELIVKMENYLAKAKDELWFK